jgi:hypothetical protein
MNEIINRVSNSSLMTIDLDELYIPEERVVFDLKVFLFQELILKEMDFRKSLSELNWEVYRGKSVAILCSADAILPSWSFLLVSSYLDNVTKHYVVGDLNALDVFLIEEKLNEMDFEKFKDHPVVIKGCTKYEIPIYAYGRLIQKLKNVCKSIMFGEPCSTVPIYKRPKIN